MNGLLQKALEFKRRNRPELTLLGSEEFGEFSDLNISESDRAEIMEQLEGVVESTKSRIDPTAFEYDAKKRAGVLPLIINVSAIIVVAVVVLFVVMYFENQQADIVTERTAIESAEGVLLETLRSESEEQIQLKNREINNIQQQLSNAESARDELETELSTRLADREAALQEELAQQLEAERERYLDQGMSSEEVDAQIAQFEESARQEYQTRVDEVRAELEAERVRQQEALDEIVADYQSSLQDAEASRSQLLEQFEARETEIRREASARESELQADIQDAATQIESLQAQMEEEQLVSENIAAFYSRARNQIQSSNFEAAITTIEELERYLASPLIDRLPAIANRRPVELFLADSLRDLILSEQEQQSPDTARIVQSAELISSVGAIVEDADRLAQSGNFDQAQSRYLTALRRIPAIRTAYEQIEAYEADEVAARRAEVTRLLGEGNSLYASGSLESALAAYAQALEASGDGQVLTQRVVDSIASAGYGLMRASDVAQLETAINQLETLRTVYEGTESELTSVQERVATLEADRSERVSTIESLNEQLETQTAELSAEIETYREREESLIAQYEDEIAELETRERELADASAEQREEIASLTDQLEVVRQQFAEASDDAQVARQRLAETTGTMQARIDTLSEQIPELQDMIATLSSDRDRQDAQIERLRSYERAVQQQAELAEYLAVFRDRLESETTAGTAEEIADPIEVLETKLIITRLLGSDVVQQQYPGIVERMNSYLLALTSEERAAAQVETLSDVNAFMAAALDGEEISASDALSAEANDSYRKLFAEFIERLEQVADTADTLE